MNLKALVKLIPRRIKVYKRNKLNREKYPYIERQVDKNKDTILLISHSALNGGAPVLLLYIAKELYKRGYQLLLVSLDYGELLPEFAKYCCVYVCLNNKQYRTLLDSKKDMKIGLCLCNSVVSGKVVKITKSYGVPIKTLIHEMPDAIRLLGVEGRAKEAATYSDMMVFPSSFVKNAFESVCRIKCKTIVKPQGLYLYNSNRKSILKNEAKRKIYENYGVNLTKRVVLNVASASHRKGFDIFIDMALNDPGRDYVWVGYENNSFTENFKIIPENLHLIGYVKNPDILWNFYCVADCFALTSREEPFGSVVLESFSAGVPVVAFNNCGGYIDVISNRKNGLLVEPVSAKAMINGLNKVDQLIQAGNDLKTCCLETVNKMNFSQYVDVLRENIDESKKAR